MSDLPVSIYSGSMLLFRAKYLSDTMLLIPKLENFYHTELRIVAPTQLVEEIRKWGQGFEGFSVCTSPNLEGMTEIYVELKDPK